MFAALKFLLYISVIICYLHKVVSLICYCENYCPDHNSLNGTCEGAYCFSTVELFLEEDGVTYSESRTYGCFSKDETGLMQCRSYKTKHARPKNISCCREYDLCNRELLPQVEMPPTLPPSEPNTQQLLIFCGALIAVIAALGIVIGYFCRDRLKKRLLFFKKAPGGPCRSFFNDSKSVGAASSSLLEDTSSGSGHGSFRLVQLTIGKQIERIRDIGRGRYGEVLQGKWRGESVAVKVFSTTDESSWLREKDIYQTVLLSHENILCFIAADIRGTLHSHTQMLLITAYHDLGSLYDFLRSHDVDLSAILRACRSVAAGLTHLHAQISGTTPKPSIAHRDLKTKNILVKSVDGHCCIADFGLAVKDASDFGSECINARVGTRRYMAPEILNNSINTAWFEALKSADIYAVSLVFWEVCSRFESAAPKGFTFEDYHLPYDDCVPSDPSIDDMQMVVCTRAIRPPIHHKWHSYTALDDIGRLLEECWHANPRVRWTALKVKKRLTDICNTAFNELDRKKEIA